MENPIESKKAKNKDLVYFEHHFDLECDNIESMEQVKTLLQEKVKPSDMHPNQVFSDFLFEFEEVESYKNLDVLRFMMQISVSNSTIYTRYLVGEARLSNQHLILNIQYGPRASTPNWVLFRHVFKVMRIVIIVAATIFGFYLYRQVGGVLPSFGCASLWFLFSAGFLFMDLYDRNGFMREFERVFREATRTDL